MFGVRTPALTHIVHYPLPNKLSSWGPVWFYLDEVKIDFRNEKLIFV